jgi:hypothetical protein
MRECRMNALAFIRRHWASDRASAYPAVTAFIVQGTIAMV